MNSSCGMCGRRTRIAERRWPAAGVGWTVTAGTILAAGSFATRVAAGNRRLHAAGVFDVRRLS
jgi:hypothetical protein